MQKKDNERKPGCSFPEDNLPKLPNLFPRDQGNFCKTMDIDLMKIAMDKVQKAVFGPSTPTPSNNH